MHWAGWGNEVMISSNGVGIRVGSTGKGCDAMTMGSWAVGGGAMML